MAERSRRLLRVASEMKATVCKGEGLTEMLKLCS